MDLRQLEYMVMICEEKSITKAAKKLYITQSALNQQLQKLEMELGTSLFIRTRSDWKLTQAGEIYIRAAKNILNIKKDTYSQIKDLAELVNRSFSVGLIPERGVDMFTAIYPTFHRMYPKAIVEPIEYNVRLIQKFITQGQLDLGLATLSREQRDDNVYHHMADEEIFLAVPISHPLSIKGTLKAQEAPDISLKEFSDELFILMSPPSTMRQLENNFFEQESLYPKVLFSTRSHISKHRMVKAGVSCAFLPAFYARSDENIRYFRLERHPHWEITMCTRKDTYLSVAEKNFLDLCHDYWKNIDTL